ncbi:uncharacterized protein KY384_002722 [Bacidia gigantensis]|uniref:uncharacterized protein n=1 Tax=Bacidia gigantensis TaxID=2732470 RepID=UPI001D05A860|nr:uncharacterized protein KY384_002722 [Bacidia gigantensis]KAG8532844.1 hypothetical protein KY384_002722 [Bacidia gigantensis]
MAEDGQQVGVSSAFPAPPPFYKSFTAENISQLQDHLESTGAAPLTAFDPTDPEKNIIPDNSSVPSELQNLIPPSIPANGAYRSFGTVHSTKPPPPSELPAPPSQAQLLKTIHQILLKFLHITHILSIDPSMKFYGAAWDQLETLFRELHEGINAWRPHQARETLIRMMEDQIKKLDAENQMVRDAVNEANAVVEGIGHASKDARSLKGGEVERQQKANQESEKRKRKDKVLWETIEREVGKI